MRELSFPPLAVLSTSNASQQLSLQRFTHTHTDKHRAKSERVTSEGQCMERWKVTPPDTVPTLAALYPLTIELNSEEDADGGIQKHIRTCPRVPVRSHVSSQYAAMCCRLMSS